MLLKCMPYPVEAGCITENNSLAVSNPVSMLYPTEVHGVYKNCLFLLHKTQLEGAGQTHDWPDQSVFCLHCTTIFCLAEGHMDFYKAVTLVQQSLWHAVWDHCKYWTRHWSSMQWSTLIKHHPVFHLCSDLWFILLWVLFGFFSIMNKFAFHQQVFSPTNKLRCLLRPLYSCHPDCILPCF